MRTAPPALPALLGGTLLAMAAAAAPPAAPRLLQVGWGTPMAETLPGRIATMEKENPFFDACVIGIQLRGARAAKAGRAGWDDRFCWSVFGAGRVQWDNVKDDVAAVRAAADTATRLRFFLRFNVIPGNVDWFDPAWDAIAHNASIAGRILREGKCEGVFFDIEEYGKTEYGQGLPFRYASQPQYKDHTFAEYAAQAQRRGREWIAAFQKEAPAAVIIFAWAHSYYANQDWRKFSGAPDWNRVTPVAESHYLLAPFVDGVIEGAGPGVRLFDGCEYTYGFRNAADFALARQFVDQGWRYSAVPDLYQQKMRGAFATEMDRYCRQRGGFHPDAPEKNYFTPEQLAMALRFSLTTGDGYSWVYSESPRWWPQEQLSPAYLQAFTEARQDRPFGQDPAAYAALTIPKPQAGHDGVPRAVTVRGPDADVLFADLWKTCRPIMDLPLEARFRTDPEQTGIDANWFAVGLDETGWGPIRVDAFWEEQGFAELDGVGWYRLRFQAPAPLPPGRILLAFGALDEEAEVWLNARHVASYPGPWNHRFEVDVTDALKPGAENLLAVRVFGGVGAGGLWAPIKLVVRNEIR